MLGHQSEEKCLDDVEEPKWDPERGVFRALWARTHGAVPGGRVFCHGDYAQICSDHFTTFYFMILYIIYIIIYIYKYNQVFLYIYIYTNLFQDPLSMYSSMIWQDDIAG